MKISAHTNITNPEKSGYPYLESISSYANIFDEVIVVDGGSTDGSLAKIRKIPKVRIIKGHKWPHDFDWTLIAKNAQLGLEACEGDWACKFDTDYILHEKFKKKIRELAISGHLPLIRFWKNNFTLIDRWIRRGGYPFMINKKMFKNLGYGIGDTNTFLFPIMKERQENGIWYGKSTRGARGNESSLEVFVYDFTFMSKKQVINQQKRFSKALDKFRGVKHPENYPYLDKFIEYMKNRARDNNPMDLEDHSCYILDRVKKIKPSQFGFDMFGNHSKMRYGKDIRQIQRKG